MLILVHTPKFEVYTYRTCGAFMATNFVPLMSWRQILHMTLSRRTKLLFWNNKGKIDDLNMDHGIRILAKELEWISFPPTPVSKKWTIGIKCLWISYRQHIGWKFHFWCENSYVLWKIIEKYKISFNLYA